MSSNEECHEQEQHEHCEHCHKTHCHLTAKPPISCHMMSCDLDCGHRFHACKLAEHLQLCGNQRVACINRDYGCPLFMARKDRGIHLETCPASVIHCTMEWNRWPVYSKERRMRVPFVQDNLHARFGQLDVALALRDQRMLNEGLKAPRSTRRVLRNNLTLRFPAVPLKAKWSNPELDQQSSVSQTISDDEADTPWGLANNPPGLQRSVCSQLFQATKRTTESLTTALSLAIGGPTSGANHELDNCPESIEVNGNTDGSLLNHMLEPVPEDSQVNLNICNDSTMLNSIQESSASNGVNGLGANESGASMVNESSNELINGLSYETVLTGEDHKPLTNGGSYPPPPPALPPTLKEILALDLTIEQITRYQAKPKSMYTFLCALEFRRDEYPWHFRNVHNEIHSGLNGWLEHRCPLSHYGCTFSLRRLYPTCKGSKVIYNTAVESFGVQPHIPECHLNCSNTPNKSLNKDITVLIEDSPSREQTPEIYTSRDYDSLVKVDGNIALINKVNGMRQTKLATGDGYKHNDNDNMCNGTDSCNCEINRLSFMPFEVLQHIARFLDGFSLSNLALTSKTLRDVCCSLLEEKGIVTMEWERRREDNRNRWFITYKRWLFSTAFDPVKQWGYEDNIHMSEHLKTCQFFHREMKTEPVMLPELGSSGLLLHRVPANMSLV